jgi:Ca-activated chloride channel family protein
MRSQFCSVRIEWLMLFALMICCGVLPRVHASTGPDEFGAGTLMLKSPGAEAVKAPRMHTEVHMEISGIIARVDVRQRFTNPGNTWVEGTYAFPLPENSAVDRMRMEIGTRIIEGEIREKVDAQRLYEQARANGQRATVVHQQRPNLFRTAVANIGPGETIEIRIGYLQIVEQNAGHYSLRFPLTITPRYIPGARDAAELPLTMETPTATISNAMSDDDTSSLGDLLPPLVQANVEHQSVSFDIDLDAGAALETLESLYHPIAVTKERTHSQIHLQNERVAPDHDFVLTWTPKVHGEPAVAAYQEHTDAGNHVLLMLMPPQEATVITTPRDVIFIVDTSGSMQGTSIEQARAALLKGLDTLTPRDRFNIIEFNSDFSMLYPQTVKASAQNIGAARDFVNELVANGGTEMYAPLSTALSMPVDREYLRQVMFMTDGAVSNEDQLMQMIGERLGDARLFTVGIGSAPNAYFMRKAAQLGHGTFTYIGSTDEVDRRMSELLQKLKTPVLTNIELHWPNDARVEYAPEKFTDLYAGEPIVVTARVAKEAHGVLTISGTARSAWTRQISLDSTQTRNGVATLWARNRIEAIMDQRAAGVADTELRKQVLPLALQYGLVSNYTSLIAIDRTPVRPPEDALASTRIPNTKPNGLGWNVPAYPKTATPATLQMIIGALLLILATFAFHIDARLRNRL